MGIAGLIIGIVSVVLCWLPGVGQVLASVGLILSIISVVKGKHRGPGVAGVITSAVSLVIGLFIVVAILLTPSTMKYMDNAQTSTDIYTYDSVVSACNGALLSVSTSDNPDQLEGRKLVLTGTPEGWTYSFDCPVFIEAMQQILGSDWETAMKLKSSQNKAVIITIKDNQVERTREPKKISDTQ